MSTPVMERVCSEPETARSTVDVCFMSTAHGADDIRVFRKEIKSLLAAGIRVTSVVCGDKLPADAPPHCFVTTKGFRSSLERFVLAAPRVFFKALGVRAKYYHFQDPDMLIPALVLKLVFRRRIVYDVHEDLPRQILNRAGIPVWGRKVLSRFLSLTEAVVARCADGIVAATPAIGRRFPKEKTVLVQNFLLSDEVLDCGDDYQQRDQVASYVGRLSVVRGGWEVLEALERLPKERDFRLNFAGMIVPSQLEAEFRKHPGWQRVIFFGHVSRREMGTIMAKARMGLVLFHPGPNHTDSQPNKLFEYMGAGLPIIASDFPRWRELIEGAKCGILVDPLKPAEIAAAIEWVLDNPKAAEEMGARGRKAVTEQFSWDREKAKLLHFYREGLGL